MDVFFTIKDFPNDVYNAVGKIIQYSQEFEQDYKNLAKMLKLKIKNLENSSLNRINRKLNEANLISKTEYNVLEKVIDYRNYINHEFYLTDFRKTNKSYEEKLESIEQILNTVNFCIFEANDLIKNKVDNLKGDLITRPTVFDTYFK